MTDDCDHRAGEIFVIIGLVMVDLYEDEDWNVTHEFVFIVHVRFCDVAGSDYGNDVG